MLHRVVGSPETSSIASYPHLDLTSATRELCTWPGTGTQPSLLYLPCPPKEGCVHVDGYTSNAGRVKYTAKSKGLSPLISTQQ